MGGEGGRMGRGEEVEKRWEEILVFTCKFNAQHSAHIHTSQ